MDGDCSAVGVDCSDESQVCAAPKPQQWPGFVGEAVVLRGTAPAAHRRRCASRAPSEPQSRCAPVSRCPSAHSAWGMQYPSDRDLLGARNSRISVRWPGLWVPDVLGLRCVGAIARRQDPPAEFALTTQHPLGGGGGNTPSPHPSDADFKVVMIKRKLIEEIDLGYCWYTNFLDFWVPDHPTPHPPYAKLCPPPPRLWGRVRRGTSPGPEPLD